MTIRPLLPADAPAFYALRLEALRHHPASFGESVEEALATGEAGFAARLAAPAPDAVFGAFQDGALVGMAGFLRQKRLKMMHKGLLWGVYVRAEAGRRGLGRALVRRVLEHAGPHVLMVQATVLAENVAARALYQSLGFEAYGVERGALWLEGRLLDEALLVRWLHDASALSGPAAPGYEPARF
jgi:ribosomal protein S18 acetylase RimI-like enzyme